MAPKEERIKAIKMLMQISETYSKYIPDEQVPVLMQEIRSNGVLKSTHITFHTYTEDYEMDGVEYTAAWPFDQDSSKEDPFSININEKWSDILAEVEKTTE